MKSAHASPSIQLPLAVRWLRAPDFDTYAEGGNAESVAAVRRLADGARGMPLFLHGPTGSGKSHLLQAAAREAHRHGRRSVYLPLSTCLGSPFTGAETLEGFETMSLICLDQIDALRNHPEWTMALLRLMDALRDRNAGLLLASRESPDDLRGALPPDLHTRLGACAVFGLHPLNDVGLRNALRRQARARGLALEEGVADYLVRRLPRDPARLMAVLDALDQASLSARRRLTIPFVQQCLAPPGANAPTSARTGSD